MHLCSRKEEKEQNFCDDLLNTIKIDTDLHLHESRLSFTSISCWRTPCHDHSIIAAPVHSCVHIDYIDCVYDSIPIHTEYVTDLVNIYDEWHFFQYMYI